MATAQTDFVVAEITYHILQTAGVLLYFQVKRLHFFYYLCYIMKRQQILIMIRIWEGHFFEAMDVLVFFKKLNICANSDFSGFHTNTEVKAISAHGLYTIQGFKTNLVMFSLPNKFES